jgi:hypothetical protein
VEPVFLLAPPRSCSTVATAMLAQHPRVFGFPELVLFTAPTVGEILAGSGGRSKLPPAWQANQLSGLLRTVAHLHERRQDGAALAQARAWLEQRLGWSGAELMRHLLEVVHPKTGVEKSPDTVTDVVAFRRCVRAFPNARYIHLARHPVTTMRSMFEHWRHLHPTYETDRLASKCARAWYDAHDRIATYLTGLPPDRSLVVRAEDLLGRPDLHLPRLLEWLGHPWDTAIVDRMQRTHEWCFAGMGPTGRLLGGDLKFMRDPRLRKPVPPGPVSFDEAWGISRQRQKEVLRLARYLGY